LRVHARAQLLAPATELHLQLAAAIYPARVYLGGAHSGRSAHLNLLPPTPLPNAIPIHARILLTLNLAAIPSPHTPANAGRLECFAALLSSCTADCRWTQGRVMTALCHCGCAQPCQIKSQGTNAARLERMPHAVLCSPVSPDPLQRLSSRRLQVDVVCALKLVCEEICVLRPGHHKKTSRILAQKYLP